MTFPYVYVGGGRTGRWTIDGWNEREFTAFYAEHYAAVREYAARVVGTDEAEDVAQETMLRALCRSGGVDLTGSPRPWLYFVARNVGIDQHRRRRPVPTDGDVLSALVPPVPDEAVAVVTRGDVVRVLGQAMRRLCRRDREVLVLHEVEGMGIPEIARRDGVTPNAIRQRLFRARNNLGRLYESLGGIQYAIFPPVAPKVREAVADVARAVSGRAEAAAPAVGMSAVDGIAAAVAIVAVVGAGAGAAAASAPAVPPAFVPQAPQAPDPRVGLPLVPERVGAPGAPGLIIGGRKLHLGGEPRSEWGLHVDAGSGVEDVKDLAGRDRPPPPGPACTVLRCAAPDVPRAAPAKVVRRTVEPPPKPAAPPPAVPAEVRDPGVL